jgi:hypothetical protein
MNRMSLRALALAASALFAGAAAQAANVVVDALANSSSGGAGANAISLSSGQSFSVSVDPADLWSAGAVPRWSNADGLTGTLFATGSDDSGQAAGTQIGADFGPLTIGNLTTAFGTLVGQIDSGDFFVIGTSFNGVASATGMLKLYYWDSNAGDNLDHVTASVATISAVPEPSTYGLMLAGMGLVGWMARRRRD